ncbi:MAG TPA: ATP-dependent DNA ligase [Gemmatimonadales bacterium]|nr:ATP-dependent DNA ligase [Gemmatimonadales bacterium]
MKAFARLYSELDETTATNEKVAALRRYFASAPPADAAWAVHFLTGRRLTRLVAAAALRAWAAEEAAIPDWLFEECYHAVGDLAEVIALLLPESTAAADRSLSQWVEERLLALRGQAPDAQRAIMLEAWRTLGTRERFVWNKLITGGFRVGVSQQLVVRALSEVSGVPEGAVAHRLMGAWDPTPEFFARVTGADVSDTDASRPYPFCLAYPLDGDAAELGDPSEWLAEWKWDGIRAQLIRREGRTWLWSRGEELLNGRFPEVESAASLLPEGTVIDGELLPWREQRPLRFAQLQRRIGRKTLGAKLLEDIPVALLAFDLLELIGHDLRSLPLRERRARLEQLLGAVPGERIVVSPEVAALTWEEARELQATARSRGAEGMMLKRRSSPYRAGRGRGDWWKWKVEPLTVDAVLIYAETGHGRRAGLFTDYTFGVWDGDRLVPFAKAYSGLSDEEIRRVDAFIRRHTIDRFGPVRTVKPELVFELAFEGIQRSSRHKSGIAVRFPRMARWRTDKRAEDADTLETVRALLQTSGDQ